MEAAEGQNITVGFVQEGAAGPVTVSIVGDLPTIRPLGRIRYTASVRVAPSGALTVNAAFAVEPESDGATVPPLCRFGVVFEVPQTVTEVTWYGRGPHEKYVCPHHTRATHLCASPHLYALRHTRETADTTALRARVSGAATRIASRARHWASTARPCPTFSSSTSSRRRRATAATCAG
jgi:hypothetical protein